MSAGRESAFDALALLYADVGRLLEERKPLCEMSGRCCNFKAEDHQLWASDLEVAYALHSAKSVVPEADDEDCPWWKSGLCTLREGRPLGCRLYFCDPSWEDEMGLAYEKYHQQLRAIHETYGVSYGYKLFVEAVRKPPQIELPS
ncbi:MAG: Fe-S-cluster containining protein [Pseudohongiellaceae bacterium]